MTEPLISTRHRDAVPEGVPLPGQPRLGRRESEPHSIELTYIYDVLKTNFPNDRPMWDLHHYFLIDGEKVDLQFDVSFFKGLSIPYDLPSYQAERFEGRIPDLALNILSKSTYNNDIGLIAEQCRILGIPVYVVFNPHLPAPKTLRAPYLKVHVLQPDGTYHAPVLKEHCMQEGEEKVDLSKTIEVPPLGITFGMMKLSRSYDGTHPRYRLILIDTATGERLLSAEELALKRAEEERKRAEEERKRAEEEKKAKEDALRRLEEVERELKRLRK